jgi:hypothetical protein
VAASVWQRQTTAGFQYLDVFLSRSWKLKNGEREGYSRNFFENNADAIVDRASGVRVYSKLQGGSDQ